MKQILIPVDFSESTFNSCKYAIEIATKTEPVSIWLFHVYASQSFYNASFNADAIISEPILPVDFIEEMKEMRKISDANMNRLKADVSNYINEKGYTNFTLNKFLVSGEPEWLIEDVCEELHTDGIIMSTSGTGNKTPLEGSMAMHIMGRAQIPVIAVPGQYSNFKFSNVLYATKLDNTTDDIKAIKLLLSLFKHHDFTLYVVHFRKYGKDIVTMKELEDVFVKERLENRVRLMIVNDENNTDATITSVTTQNSIDLIAFITHKTNPLKLLFSRGIHKDDFIATGLPVIGLPNFNKQ